MLIRLKVKEFDSAARRGEGFLEYGVKRKVAN